MAVIFSWDGGYVFEERGLPYRQNQEIEDINIYQVAQEIFNTGLNVMLMHCDPGIVVAVDTKRFQQR